MKPPPTTPSPTKGNSVTAGDYGKLALSRAGCWRTCSRRTLVVVAQEVVVVAPVAVVVVAPVGDRRGPGGRRRRSTEVRLFTKRRRERRNRMLCDHKAETAGPLCRAVAYPNRARHRCAGVTVLVSIRSCVFAGHRRTVVETILVVGVGVSRVVGVLGSSRWPVPTGPS